MSYTPAFKSSLCISAAPVNFLYHKYQCLQVAERFTSLRRQGARLGWWWSSVHRHSFCSFTCSTPWCTGCTAALNPAELLSQAASIAEVSLDLPVWHGLDSLAVRTFFLREPADHGAVGVSYLKSQSLHHWVQQCICPPQFCDYCSSHPK